jgi:hypothetical protein
VYKRTLLSQAFSQEYVQERIEEIEELARYHENRILQAQARISQAALEHPNQIRSFRVLNEEEAERRIFQIVRRWRGQTRSDDQLTALEYILRCLLASPDRQCNFVLEGMLTIAIGISQFTPCRDTGSR